MSTDRVADNVNPGQTAKHLSDVGNAQRFVQEHGQNVRYCWPWKRWLVWDGKRWKIDNDGEVQRLAKKTVANIFSEATTAVDSDEAKNICRHALQSQRAERLSGMLKMAHSEAGIPIDVDDLDARPWLLNVENGTLDLETQRLRRHERGDYLTKLASVEYPTNSGVECPLWLEFLERIFDGDRDLILFVKRLLAISLVGQVYEHILPIFYGTGANGKSVFIETWCFVLGRDYAIKAPPDLLLARRNDAHPTERADLFGKRFVAAVESGKGHRLNEPLCKELSGGDRIRARRMRQDFWEFRPSHLAVLVTNHKPIVSGTDHGIWRRLRLVPFNVTIPPEEQDKHLTEKLEAEAGNILKWAVGGLIDWQQLGLGEPEVVLEATSEYRTSQDVAAAFLDEECKVNSMMKVKASQLYGAYVDWAKASGEQAINQREFGIAMTERGFVRTAIDGRKWYRGVALRDKSD